MYTHSTYPSITAPKINFTPMWTNFFVLKGDNIYFLDLTYRGIHEKGLGDVVSAVSYTIYILSIYPSVHRQLRQLSNPFREFPCILRNFQNKFSLGLAPNCISITIIPGFLGLTPPGCISINIILGLSGLAPGCISINIILGFSGLAPYYISIKYHTGVFGFGPYWHKY